MPWVCSALQPRTQTHPGTSLKKLNFRSAFPINRLTGAVALQQVDVFQLAMLDDQMHLAVLSSGCEELIDLVDLLNRELLESKIVEKSSQDWVV